MIIVIGQTKVDLALVHNLVPISHLITLWQTQAMNHIYIIRICMKPYFSGITFLLLNIECKH